jgi:hypothetical protein
VGFLELCDLWCVGCFLMGRSESGTFSEWDVS